MTQTAIQKAARAAGGQSALARSLQVTPQAVQKMCATGSVPAVRVIQIEALTGVSRHDLRPDLYPEAPPTLNQMMPQISPADQSGKPSVNPSSTQVA